MNFTKLAKIFFICLSFSFLQTYSMSTHETSAAIIAQELIDAIEKLRAVQASRRKIKYFEDEDLDKYSDNSDIKSDDFQEFEKNKNGTLVQALEQFEIIIAQVDDYFEGEKTIEPQKTFKQSLQERLENIEH